MIVNPLFSKVVCRQLGYLSRGALALTSAHFGQGTGPIVLDNVQCGGLELYLTDCDSNGLYVHNCRHAEDASVRCQGELVSTLSLSFSAPPSLFTHMYCTLRHSDAKFLNFPSS